VGAPSREEMPQGHSSHRESSAPASPDAALHVERHGRPYTIPRIRTGAVPTCTAASSTSSGPSPSDPDYALPMRGSPMRSAGCSALRWKMVPPTQAVAVPPRAALKALELDDSLSEPHVSLSRVILCTDRESDRCRARVAQPISSTRTVRWPISSPAAVAPTSEGRRGRAGGSHRALQLDPVSSWNSAIAGFFLCEPEPERGGQGSKLRKAIELEPSFFLPWSLSSVIDLLRREVPGRRCQRPRRACACPPAADWRGRYAGYALAMAGRRGDVHATLDEMENLSRGTLRPAIARVWCYLGLADHERTLEWLEVGYQQRTATCPPASHAGVQAAASRPPIPGPVAPPGPPAVAVASAATSDVVWRPCFGGRPSTRAFCALSTAHC